LQLFDFLAATPSAIRTHPACVFNNICNNLLTTSSGRPTQNCCKNRK